MKQPIVSLTISVGEESSPVKGFSDGSTKGPIRAQVSSEGSTTEVTTPRFTSVVAGTIFIFQELLGCGS